MWLHACSIKNKNNFFEYRKKSIVLKPQICAGLLLLLLVFPQSQFHCENVPSVSPYHPSAPNFSTNSCSSIVSAATPPPHHKGDRKSSISVGVGITRSRYLYRFKMAMELYSPMFKMDGTRLPSTP